MGDGLVIRHGQPDEEGRAFSSFSFEMKRTLELVDHDAARQRQALPGAAPDFLRRHEWLEDAPAHIFGNAVAGVADRDLDIAADRARAHGNAALACWCHRPRR